MNYIDKPYQIGDFVQSGEHMVTVIDVGFRSTRIRTADTSIISIPNGQLADMVVNNLGERNSRRMNITIGVAYHTPPDLISKFVKGLRMLNQEHPKTNNELFYIHLSGLADSSINIMFVVYLLTDDYGKELRYKEEIFMNIIKLAEALGVQFAYPSQSLYVETLPGQKGHIPDYEPSTKNADNILQEFMQTYKRDLTAKHIEDEANDSQKRREGWAEDDGE